jgi:voltage-gated potassium channel
MVTRALDHVGFLLRDRETRKGRATNAALYALNAAFIAAYVLSTYPLSPTHRTALRVTELGLATVFVGEYVVRVYAAEDSVRELRNPYTVVDLVAVLPVFFVPWPDVGFLRGLHTLRVFRFLRLLVDEQQFLGRTLHVRTVRRIELSVTIFLIFFIATGFLYAVEVAANDAIETFGDAFYYTVIAVSTVGFGDIVPQTEAGRWVTVAAVLVGFVLVPWQASRLRDPAHLAGADCPRCGARTGEGDRYCRRCGLALTDDEHGETRAE